MNDTGEFESASEEEAEEGHVGEAHQDEEHTGCEFEQGAALVVTQILSVQMKKLKMGSDIIYFKPEQRCMIRW